MSALPRDKVKALLKKYALLFIDTSVAANEKHCVSLARRAGFPVVLQVTGDEKVVRTEQEVAGAYRALIAGAKARGMRIKGVGVRHHIEGATAACGILQDRSFGAVLFVEGKVKALRLAPLTSGEVEQMIDAAQPMRRDGLAGMVATLSQLAVKNPRLQLCLDPVIIVPNSHPVAAGFAASAI